MSILLLTYVFSDVCLTAVIFYRRNIISKNFYNVFFLLSSACCLSLTSRKEKWKPMSQQIFIRNLSLFLFTTKHFQISTITPPNKSSIMMVTKQTHILYLSFSVTSLIIVPFFIETFLWKIWLLTTLHFMLVSPLRQNLLYNWVEAVGRFVCSLRNHFQIIQNKIKIYLKKKKQSILK